MGLLSSSKSSSAAQTVGQAPNTGFSEVAGQASSINLNITTGSTSKSKVDIKPVINLTDQGAIKAAQSIAEQSQRNIEIFSGTVAEALAGAFAASQATIGAAAESQRGEVENISLAAVKWGALALAVYAGARVFWKGA